MGHKARWWQWGMGAVLLVSLLGLGGGCSRAAWSATYADVPPEHWAAGAIEALAQAGLSGGCGAGLFCPEMPVTRAQVALLLGRTVYGSDFTPPVPGGQFEDVPLAHPAAGWIEWSVTQGLLGACSSQRFCPDELITRAQLAVYLLRGLYGSNYTPPPAQGGVFSDVTGDTPAAAWIEQLPLEGLSAGCGQGLYCPQAVVTRAQLAVFLARLREQLTPPTDQDQDGLSDVQEQALGTHPANPDSDADGLLDGAEVNTHHTNPLAADSDGDTFSDGEEIAVHTNPNDSNSRPVVTVPPDPASVAPPVDQTVATTVHAATEFLYRGANPIQTGVTAGTIDPRRAAVLRGKVLGRNNSPLSGVTITILNHPELGQTLSRADGRFDLAVNGGGSLTVNYQKTGYLPAQRQIDVPWQDYELLPDVVLIAADPQVAAIDLTANTAIQIARGSPVSDADGTRQATLLFPQGTQAQMVMPDGSTQPLTSLHVRATEYTVGPDGPNAMPAELPPASAYTYAVELSADEALAAGATNVRFSQPVPFYVENFLNFPVGTLVPVGYYDRAKATWIAAPNGRVIKVLDAPGGVANLDIDGNGTADAAAALAAFGITDAERRRIAALYSANQTLWRVPITHFTPWDCNWPAVPPDGAAPPKVPPGENDPQRDEEPEPDECPGASGSVIDCQNQVLGEAIDIAGTPYTLHYASERADGYRAANQLDLPLSGNTLPPNVKRIDYEIKILGRTFTKSFQPEANVRDAFTWDGLDAYQRPVKGTQRATVRIGYVYDAAYAKPAEFDRSFGVFSGVPITGSRAREEITLWQESGTRIRGQGSLGNEIGGWSIDVHHVYDFAKNTIYRGDGTKQVISRQLSVSALAETGNIITTIAGDGDLSLNNPLGDGGSALEADLHPAGVAAGSDGSVYIADWLNGRIRRVGLDGIITTVAGSNNPCGGNICGDGRPATEAVLFSPEGVTVGPDGSLYIADNGTFFGRGDAVRRVAPNGIITTVAGTGVAGFSGDGGPATSAQLANPDSVAVAPDGSVYIADSSNNRIRRVGPDGIITTVAGTGNPCQGGSCGDGGPAIQAAIASPDGVAVAPDGSLYVTQKLFNYRIRRIGPDGVITTVAGKDCNSFFNGDGISAMDACIAPNGEVVFGRDGSFYIADWFRACIINKLLIFM